MPNTSKVFPYIPAIVNGSILIVLIGLVIDVKTDSKVTLTMVPEIQKLRETVVTLQVTIAGMTPTLEILAGVEVPPPDVLRRLESLENRMDKVQYGSLPLP